MYRKILLAYDGSDDSREAFTEAGELASLSGAELAVLAVIDVALESALAEGATVGGAVDEQVGQVRAMLTEAERQFSARGIVTTTALAAGNPGERIAAMAREIGADLIVVGHRQHGVWARWMQEPVGAFLLNNTPCSLLVCPARPAPR
jgi:nucleotide-binding universal stress UspA family protein